MRALSLLLVVLLGLGLSFVSSPANAGPCPLHGDVLTAAGPGSHELTRVASFGAAAEAVATAADRLLGAADHPVSGHQVPEGQPCCHIAGTAALSVGPTLGLPAWARALRARAWLPPRAAPVPDIFRPPASA